MSEMHWGGKDEMMEILNTPVEIKELPPGVVVTFCTHFEGVSLSSDDDLKFSSALIHLEEIPNEVGYHGTCPTCGARYFSRPDGSF